MRQIKIKSLALMNFKGQRNLAVNFKDMTIISGANASGKTSIFDAFTWLLFGKDSNNRSDFNIKTLDENNMAIPRIEHQVSGILEIDGRDVELRKVYKEKWQKKKGSEIPEMTGHTTDYFVNDVPMNESQYKERIDSIISETAFKMLTSPSYFNLMKWEERRAVLTEMAGAKSDLEIADGNIDFILLLEQLNGKTIEEYKREITNKKKRLKDEIETIPTRIDEVTRTMPEMFDYSELESEILTIENNIKNLENDRGKLVEINNSKNAEIQKILDQKFALQRELMQVKHENKLKAQNAFSPIEMQLKQAYESATSLTYLLTSKKRRLNDILNRVAVLNFKNDEERERWKSINAKEFILTDHPTHCDTCKQPLPDDQLESDRNNALDNFNKTKERDLNEIQSGGIKRNEEIAELDKSVQPLSFEINALDAEKSDKEKEIEEIKIQLENAKNTPISVDPREEELEKQIESIIIPEQVPVVDNTAGERKMLGMKIDEIKKKLASKDQLNAINIRIAELEEMQRDYAQQLANLEKVEFTIDQFNRVKMNNLESRINAKFSVVKFRLFKTQINGGADECCDCLVNGVPFSDVNTAGKINAGIDIINALTTHMGANAPIWIDNCESVNEVLPSMAQIILLYVTVGKLTIN